MQATGHRQVAVFAPAKINLFLAVTGRREDGRHNLVSVAAPVRFGDMLWAVPQKGPGEDIIACAHSEVPSGRGNLVLMAAREFRKQRPLPFGLRFFLKKRIPPGAGLGGGSSNAVAALKAMNLLAEQPLRPGELMDLAARLGSDCPLFLHSRPVVIRGTGAKVKAVSGPLASKLSGTPVILFKPEYSVETARAYRQLAARGHYMAAEEAERRLGEWLQEEDFTHAPAVNSFEPLLRKKFLSHAVLRESLREAFGAAIRLTGSGSACYILGKRKDAKKIRDFILDRLGPDAFYIDTHLI